MNPRCSIDGCPNRARSKDPRSEGLCQRHFEARRTRQRADKSRLALIGPLNRGDTLQVIPETLGYYGGAKWFVWGGSDGMILLRSDSNTPVEREETEIFVRLHFEMLADDGFGPLVAEQRGALWLDGQGVG